MKVGKETVGPSPDQLQQVNEREDNHRSIATNYPGAAKNQPGRPRPYERH